MSCASLPQLWNIQTALHMVFQQTPTCTCLLIKPDEDCTAQPLNLLWTQNSFIWFYLKNSLDHSAPPCAVDPISPCVTLRSSIMTKEGMRAVGASAAKQWKLLWPVLPIPHPRARRAGLLLTKHVDSGGAVAGACHTAGHAGVIPPVLQPNPLQVQAPVAAHAHVGIGNQLPKERRNLSLGKHSLTMFPLALLDYVTLLKITCSWRILLELFLLSIFHTKLILLKSFSSTLYLLLKWD